MDLEMAAPVEKTKRILVIDDDRKLSALIRDYLKPLGYDVSLSHTGPEGLEEAKEGAYEAIILDVMLPGMDGFEVLRELRKTSNVPVLMLTSMGEEADRIVGLEIGADDYLPKTFSTRELLARLRAVTRRSHITEKEGSVESEDLVVGDLRLSEATHVVTQGEEVLELTPLEFALLAALMGARGRVKSREQLIDEVSQRKFDIFDRSIDVHISALRKKLGDDPKSPKYIKTVRAVGYQLVDFKNDSVW